MKSSTAALSALFALAAFAPGTFGAHAPVRSTAFPTPPDSERTVAYVGGHVWNGKSFGQRPIYVRDGQFVEAPAESDSTVDLGGGYIVPPFGDAHTHAMGVGGAAKAISDSLFLGNGIFYAADLTNPYSEIRTVEDFFERPTTVDVAFANGGLTTTGVHPTAAMERRFTDTDEVTLDNLTLQGDAYWFLDTVADVRTKWPDYLAQEPDVVKVYLTYVARGLEKGTCYGLCPDVLHAVVKRAHRAGKSVYAHVNTAADVRFALDGGVDVLAHLPLGNDDIPIEESAPFRLADTTIQRIGEINMVVTPTAALLAEDLSTFRTDTLQQEIALQRRQVRQLHEAGAQIALGAHGGWWEDDPLREVMYFHAYDFFDNRTLLNLWTKTTPQAIFPGRKIGALVPGHEASFLSLGCNPIENFDCVKALRLRVKEGHRLASPES